MDKSNDGPLFVSWRSSPNQIGWTVASAISFGFGALLIFASLFESSAAGLFLAGVGVLFIVVAVLGLRSARRQEWRYAFYEDHFEVTHARHFKQPIGELSVPLSEIKSVRPLSYDVGKAIPNRFGGNYHAPRIIIDTTLQTFPSVFEVFQNPYNKEIGMHLYDWLAEKVDPSGSGAERSSE